MCAQERYVKLPMAAEILSYSMKNCFSYNPVNVMLMPPQAGFAVKTVQPLMKHPWADEGQAQTPATQVPLYIFLPQLEVSFHLDRPLFVFVNIY